MTAQHHGNITTAHLMNFEQQPYDTVMDRTMQPIQATRDDGGGVAEDESPTLAFLRAKKNAGLNSGSNHSVPLVDKPEVAPSAEVLLDLDVDPLLDLDVDPMMDFHLLANQEGTEFGDDGSINPLDAFDPDDNLMLSGDDADFVDMALRSPDGSYENSHSTGFNNSHSTGFNNSHDSVASGLSFDNLGVGSHDNDEELQRRKEQLRTETMESLNKSMSSLNDAFGRLTASMDRTNKTRELLKQFEDQQNPLEALRKEAASTGIAPTPSITGVALGTGTGSRRRRTLQRSGSSNSIGSLGSRGSVGSLGSRGRKSRDKTTRKLKRNIKGDARSRSNSRSSLGRAPRRGSGRSLSEMPDQIIVTGI